MATKQAIAAPAVPAQDFMPLHGIDHVELWVGNAAHSTYYLSRAFGFTETAYQGLETGVRDHVSHVVEQGRVRLVLTGALSSDTDIARQHAKHGDGVKVIALGVPDVDHAYREAVSRGATGLVAPHDTRDAHGIVRLAEIAAYGDTVHRFVDRTEYDGPFLPGFAPVPREVETDDSDPMLLTIDHIVGNVELGAMDTWVKYYEDVFAMTEMIHFSDEAISTEYSALMSKVVTTGDGRVKFPINEPAEGKRKSQIDEYLEFYDEAVPERIGEIGESIADLRRLGILVDRDDEGYLLQIFTKPLGDRPTIFFEIIERHGARGFGEGNFKALFEAIEREQEKRGNL